MNPFLVPGLLYFILTSCPVFGVHYTAQAQNLKNLGGGISGENNWTLSLDDLLVYKDILTNPLQFLHFTEQRNKAYGSSLTGLEDELDHLALYLKHNCYVQYAEEMVGQRENVRIVWEGARKEIDEFYSQSLVESEVPRPKQHIPPFISQIINCMAKKQKGYEARAASTLLNMDNVGREEYLNTIFVLAERTKGHGRPVPFSLIGNVDSTTLCHISGIDYSPEFDIVEHVFATAIIANQEQRLLIEIYLTQTLELEDVEVSLYDIKELTPQDHIRIEKVAEKLTQDRIDKALNLGKIGRNEFCPCGSGKKYKNCCLI